MTEVEKFMKLKDTISDLSTRKIRLEERFNAVKENLEKLIKEITDKGYDPKKLGEIKKEKEEKIKKDLEDLTEKTSDIEKTLSTIEAQQ